MGWLASRPAEMVPETFLRFPLEPAWRLPLERGREWAVLPDHDPEPGRVFVASRRWLACRDTRDGTERWRTDVSFSPSWLTAVNGSLIVAGDNGAARLSAADGQLVWQFIVPEVAPWFDHPGWRDPDAVAPIERLSGFHWAGGRLVARLGSRSLISVDGGTGKLQWQRLAPLAREYHPAYFADGRCVVAQSSDGRRWIFDAADGHVLHTGPAPSDPWPTPPIAGDERRMIVVEEGRLVALDRSTWKPEWSWDLPRPVSLSGELPQIRLIDGVLLVGVPRNDCYEVERLNPVTGQPLSTEAVPIGHDRVDLGAVALDGEVLYVAADGELRTIDCRTGAIAARQTREQFAQWRVESAANGVMFWTLPIVSPTQTPRRGQVLVMDKSEPEATQRRWLPRPGQVSSLPLGLGPGNSLRSLRVIGNEVVVVSDGEVRGYRGMSREVK
jgi:outer membrane protein assembly factor BamB